MSDAPTFYAVIPATVRYDSELSDFAKILYGEISALCDKTGICWASNSYFAELYSKTPETISRTINRLKKRGHIGIQIQKQENNIRQIWLATPIDKNVKTYPQKRQDPIDENVNSFKRNNNINSIPIGTKSKDPRSQHPIIQAIRSLMSRYPDKILWDELISQFGEDFDEIKLQQCRVAWVRKGYNTNALTWTAWYFDGIPEWTSGKSSAQGAVTPTDGYDPTKDIMSPEYIQPPRPRDPFGETVVEIFGGPAPSLEIYEGYKKGYLELHPSALDEVAEYERSVDYREIADRAATVGDGVIASTNGSNRNGQKEF